MLDGGSYWFGNETTILEHKFWWLEINIGQILTIWQFLESGEQILSNGDIGFRVWDLKMNLGLGFRIWNRYIILII